MLSEAGGHCRSPHHNTHGIVGGDEIAVSYAWHPWAGRVVRVGEVLERASGAAARCSLVGVTDARVLEIPVWMLDAAACRPARMAAEPVAALSALAALHMLLSEATRRAAIEALSDAIIAAPDSHRGDCYAIPSSPTPAGAASTRPPSGEPATVIEAAPPMECPAGSDEADVKRSAHRIAGRARQQRARAAGRTSRGRQR